MDDYDEFGNYIGADLDSDQSEVESEVDEAQAREEAVETLRAYDEDTEEQQPGGMEVDGKLQLGRGWIKGESWLGADL